MHILKMLNKDRVAVNTFLSSCRYYAKRGKKDFSKDLTSAEQRELVGELLNALQGHLLYEFFGNHNNSCKALVAFQKLLTRPNANVKDDFLESIQDIAVDYWMPEIQDLFDEESADIKTFGIDDDDAA